MILNVSAIFFSETMNIVENVQKYMWATSSEHKIFAPNFQAVSLYVSSQIIFKTKIYPGEKNPLRAHGSSLDRIVYCKSKRRMKKKKLIFSNRNSLSLALPAALTQRTMRRRKLSFFIPTVVLSLGFKFSLLGMRAGAAMVVETTKFT